ncbi:hypothetical protein ACU7M0_36525, partial [Burkholderia cenocepacia]
SGSLILQVDGQLQRNIRLLLKPLSAVLLAFMRVVSLWPVLSLPALPHRCFVLVTLSWFLPFPALVFPFLFPLFHPATRSLCSANASPKRAHNTSPSSASACAGSDSRWK